MTEQQIKECKEKYGSVIEVESDKGKFYFRKPDRIVVKKFFDTVSRSIYDASYGLCVDTVLEPTSDKLVRIEEANPGLVMTLATEIQGFFSSPSRVSSRVL